MSQTENTAQAPEVADQAVDTHEKKTPQDSFAELRKAKEDLERRVWQAEQEKIWLEKQLQQQQRPQQQPQPDDEDFDFKSLEQEEFPDGKKLVKAFGQVNKKLSAYEQKLIEKDQKIQILEATTEFKDFKDIVTPENIEKYIKADEDNRESVEKAANPLRKCYNLIKKEIDREKKSVPTISQEQKRIEEKESKPKTGGLGVRSEAVTAAAQISNSKMSKQQKNDLWAQTLAAARK